MNISRDGQIILEQVKYVPEEASDLRLRRGDVVFNNTNSREHIGKSAIFSLDEQWGFSNHITRLRLPGDLLPEFVAFQFLYLWQAGYFGFHAKQHVNQASISARTLNTQVPLIIAPMSDQQSVVRTLLRQWSTLSSAGDAVSRAVRHLDNYKDQTICDAAEGVLTDNESELAELQGRPYVSGAELLDEIRQARAEAAEQSVAPARIRFNLRPRHIRASARGRSPADRLDPSASR